MSIGSLKAKFLLWLGNIKVVAMPLFFFYQKGSYYKISGQDTLDIMNLLKPGDILCRGYNSYVDNWFIPGKYAHTGVYIGHNNIVHAVALGVAATTVIDFCRCDRICVLRPKQGQQKALQRVQALIGMPYDYAFDDSNNAYYCHLLTAEAYQLLQPKKKFPYIGFIRCCTMTPVYLALSFILNPNFEVIYLK